MKMNDENEKEAIRKENEDRIALGLPPRYYK